MTEHADVVIVGGGAAGLMAAVAAGQAGAHPLIIEKNKKPGVKILMSGGSRCNITHNCENSGIIKAFGPRGKFLHSALAGFTTRDTVRFFEDAGVPTKIEDTGKVFPVSNRAHHVLDALVAEAEQAGTTMAFLEPCLGIEPEGDQLAVITGNRRIVSNAVILTTGGLSFPGCGTTGDGYAMATRLGHTIVPTRPALVPLALREPWIAEMAGLTIPDVGLTLWDGAREAGKSRGSHLFTHQGISGPAPLNLTRFDASWHNTSALALTMDFLPGAQEAELDAWLRDESLAQGRKLLSVVLAERIPRTLGDRILEECGQARDRRAAGLSRDDRKRIAGAMKGLRCGIARHLGYEKAEVTSGGVDLREVDSRSMVSLKHPALFLAGEILDLDGPIGGYNFQAAWSTGWLAGTRAAARAAESQNKSHD